jgi:5-methylcytosine-specific restriction endonuclease McrA
MNRRPQDFYVHCSSFRVEKACPSCGIEFIGLHSNKYCRLCIEGVSSANTQRKRAEKLGLGEHFTPGEWVALIARYSGRCSNCGSDKGLAPDHVIPLSRGGANTIDNIQPLCKSCNSKKHAKTIDYRH